MALNSKLARAKETGINTPQPAANNNLGSFRRIIIEPATCDFQQCGILKSVDLDEPLQPPVKLRNHKCCLIGS